MDKYTTTLLTHAKACGITLDAVLCKTISEHADGLGTLNSNLPLTPSPKLSGKAFPGLSFASVPMASPFDFFGSQKVQPAFLFLLAPIQVDESWSSLVGDLTHDGPLNRAMLSMLGNHWLAATEALNRHIKTTKQIKPIPAGLHQVLWPTGPDRWLNISPLDDPLLFESNRLLNKHISQGVKFARLPWAASREAGLMAKHLDGQLWKLSSMPSSTLKSGETVVLPVSTPGNHLVLKMFVSGMNMTGAGVMAGVASATTALGFAESLAGKLGIEIESVAIGFSDAGFEMGHTEIRGNAWVYLVLKTSSLLSDALPSSLTSNINQFGGGVISHVSACVTNDLSAVFAALGDQVHFLADRAALIDAAPSRLDAAINLIASDPALCLGMIGYQGIEPPIPRVGVRMRESRHIYAAPIFSLMAWVPALLAEVDQVFWTQSWDAMTYSAFAKAS